MTEAKEFRILQTSVKWLRTHRIWPGKGKPYSFPFGSLLLGAPLAILNISHLLSIIINDLPITLSADMNIASAYLGCYYILITHVMKQERILKLCQNLSDFKTFGKPPNFDKTNKLMNGFSLLFRIYVYVGAVASVASPIPGMSMCEKYNKEKGLKEYCGLWVPMLLPFTYDNKKGRLLLLAVFQILGLIHIIGSSACVTFTTFEIAQHITLRIKHLNQLLREMFDTKDEHRRRLNIKNCIRYHQFIIELVDDFDSSYSSAMACYLVMTGFIFGCIVNLTLENPSIGALINLLGWLYSLFIVCYAGQDLTSTSETIPLAAFASKWNEVDLKQQKMLQLIMLSSQKPLYLHGRPVGIMSLPLFVQVLKASYSYLAILNQNM